MQLRVLHVSEASAKLSVEPFLGSFKSTQWHYCNLYDIFSYRRTVNEFIDIDNTGNDKNFLNEIINDWDFRGYQRLARAITLLLTMIPNKEIGCL